jgi:hypothetical protein
MMTTRLIAAIILMLMALYISVMNWGCVIVSSLNKKRGISKHHSTVPLVSLILAGLAYPLYPYEPKGWVVILPLIDIGNWIFVIGLPWAVVKGIQGRKGEQGRQGAARGRRAI